MMLLKTFFMLNSYNPNIPKEEWTFIKEIKTAGEYSESLGWGKYRIEISGGAGAGGAASAYHADYANWANNGENGENRVFVFIVNHSNFSTISGTIGTGASGSYANGSDREVTPGSVGVGYTNGSAGHTKLSKYPTVQSAVASGSGGGSSSLFLNGTLTVIANGGNGGASSADEIHDASGGAGGAGGMGGTVSGTGATGGVGAFGYKGSATSGAGANGYVRIYKSNIIP